MKKRLLFLVFLGFIQVSYACSCYPFDKKPTFKKINSFTEIFEAQLIKKEHNPTTSLISYYFKVEKAYKGVLKDENIVITTPSSAAACGQHIDYDSLWLIYARDGFTHRCIPNVNLSKLKKEDSNKSKTNKDLIENIAILKESNTIIETNKKGDTIAIGKLNINKQPIGCWKYIRKEKEQIITETIYYDDNGCLIKHPPYKMCN